MWAENQYGCEKYRDKLKKVNDRNKQKGTHQTLSQRKEALTFSRWFSYQRIVIKWGQAL